MLIDFYKYFIEVLFEEGAPIFSPNLSKKAKMIFSTLDNLQQKKMPDVISVVE